MGIKTGTNSVICAATRCDSDYFYSENSAIRVDTMGIWESITHGSTPSLLQNSQDLGNPVVF